MSAERNNKWAIDRLRSIDANKEIERLTADRDKWKAIAFDETANKTLLREELDGLKRELAKDGDRVYAPDGRTWQALAYAEAGKRGVYKAELDRLRSVAADAYESWTDGTLIDKQMHDLSRALGFT